MKNSLASLLFSFSVTALFIPCDLSALKNKNSDKEVTPEEQATLNAKLLLTTRYNRFASTLKLVELGADLDAHNGQEKSPREMLEEALKQEEPPMSPTSPYQQERFYCCAISKALYKEKFEIRARTIENKNKLKVLLDQKKCSVELASPVKHVLPKLAIDTTVKPITPKTNLPTVYPETPTSPNNPYYHVLCCASYNATHKLR